MPEPLTLQLEQSRRYLPGDRLEVEVDGTVLSQRFDLWASERASMGYGHTPYGRGRYGFGRSLGYGIGAYGRGVYGQGARILTLKTAQEFDSATYAVRLRVVDAKGNAGAWSASVDLIHTPPPRPPYDLAIDGDNLTFKWVA